MNLVPNILVITILQKDSFQKILFCRKFWRKNWFEEFKSTGIEISMAQGTLNDPGPGL